MWVSLNQSSFSKCSWAGSDLNNEFQCSCGLQNVYLCTIQVRYKPCKYYQSIILLLSSDLKNQPNNPLHPQTMQTSEIAEMALHIQDFYLDLDLSDFREILESEQFMSLPQRLSPAIGVEGYMIQRKSSLFLDLKLHATPDFERTCKQAIASRTSE